MIANMPELELTDIPSELVRSVLYKTIKNHIPSKNIEISVKSASKAGTDNFNGIIYRVYFADKDDVNMNSENNLPLSLILKIAPDNVVRRNLFFSRACFLREIYMYDKVLPCFRAFEKSKGLIGNGFIEYPECYRTIDMEPVECLLLEDVGIRKFRMIDRRTEIVTIDHAQLYLKALAKYHAISLALKDQQPKLFHEISSNLHDIFNRRDYKGLREFYAHQANNIMDMVMSDKNAEYLLAKLRNFFEKDILDVVVDCIENEATEHATVISYGDAHQNNTLFSYDHNGQPTEACLVDWQLSRVASPIIDIVYFIFTSTTKELRDAHFDNLLKAYHETLSKQLQRLGSDPERVFSFEIMQNHLRKYAKFGLMVASMVLPILTSNVDNKFDLNKVAEDFQNGKSTHSNSPFNLNNLTFGKRMRDVIIDMVQLGYI